MRVSVLALLLGVAFSSSAAQRDRRTTRAPATPVVRAELASVLLQSGRFDEAAREYRVLLSRDPASYDYRLGLAKALAWGDHPREAERELELLAAKRPGVAIVDSLLRTVRDAYAPTAAEAVGWLASEPGYAPYRVALARALARENMPRLAIAQYDTLLANPGAGPVPDRGTLLREMADAYAAAGDRSGGATRLTAVLALTPNDTGLRHIVAGMLLGVRRYAEAEAQYDTLIASTPTAAFFLERARVRVASGDRAGAESDLWASVGVQPTSAAYILLGDLFRERGDYRGARSMYVAASQNAPREMRMSLAAALASLDREERPTIVGPVVGEDPGWRVAEQAASDNLGVTYSVLSLRRTLPVTGSTRVSLGTEWRQLAEHSAVRDIDAAGYGATVGAWQEISYGPLLARLAADGGVVYHPLGGTIGEGDGTLSTWLFAWQGAVTVGTEPAYPSLFSTAALRPGNGGDALTERDLAVSLAGPVGQADIGARFERSLLSDGNRRVAVDATARYPLLPDIYIVYSLSRVAFAKRSTLYWDPAHYTAQGLGLELDARKTRGLSFDARLLPTYASTLQSPMAELVAPGDPVVRGALEHSSAMQFGADASLGYRARDWEIAGAVSYGRGRAADYQRGAVSVVVRLVR